MSFQALCLLSRKKNFDESQPIGSGHFAYR
jgi:hypothetical protein